ncbi:low molecular weight protein arginine phosphatase [Eubacteriales bacterium mix99]
MNILFVCTGNTCRSAMAEEMFRTMLNRKGMTGFYIRSAGIAALPGEKASPPAVAVLKEAGMDLSGHRSGPLNEKLLGEADVILAMTEGNKAAVLSRYPSVRERIHTLKEYAGTPGRDIPDPYGQSADVYRRTGEEIRHALEKIIEKWGRTSSDPKKP